MLRRDPNNHCNMADQNRINLATLQQRDPYITEILGTAKQVALYIYKDDWEKTSISGSLFVYKRSANPLHGVMILNRQGLNNLVEPITEQLEFQVNTPFLLYRNLKQIFGIWFYKPEECEQLGALMERLRQDLIKSKTKDAGGPAPAVLSLMGSQKPVDILQLLSGAQQRYDSKTKIASGSEPQHLSSTAAVTSGDVLKPTPVKLPGDITSGAMETGMSDRKDNTMEGPSQLQEMFKTIKLSQQMKQDFSQQLKQEGGSLGDERVGDPPPDVTIHPLNRSLSVSEVEASTQTSGRTLRLMSTPGLTVEEIERRQREEITLKKVPERLPEHPRSQGHDVLSHSPSTQELLNMIAAAASVGDGQGKVLPAMPQLQPTATGDGSPRIIYAGESKPSPSELLKPGDFETFDKFVSSMQALHTRGDLQSSNVLGAACPDVLLTPMAFTSHQAQGPLTPSPVYNQTAGIFERLNFLTAPSTSGETTGIPKLAPLTREQLQQALIYIIKTDEDFVSKIHEAYLASFQQVTSKR